MQYKFNVELLEAMHLGAKLAYTLPENKTFLNGSERIFQCFFSYDNDYSLMNNKYIVSMGAIPLSCCSNFKKESLSEQQIS